MTGAARLVHLALGSNLGDRRAHLDAAVAALDALPGTAVVAVSRRHETAAVGPPQPDYLNAAVAVRTTMAPRALLEAAHAIERARGRDRAAEPTWGPRPLDVDLLLDGDLVVDEPGLTVPHPRMHERAFVLAPLAEIAPDVRHPALGETVECLARRVGVEIRPEYDDHGACSTGRPAGGR